MAEELLPVSRALTGLKARKAKRAYLAAYALTGLATDGLAAAGVTLKQLQRWRDNDPEFRDLEEGALQMQDDELRKAINKFVLEGNEKVIIAAMKRLPEYSPVKKTELSVTGEVKHKHLADMPESELDEIIRAGAQLVEAEFEVVDGNRRPDRGNVPEMRRLPDNSIRGESED